MINYFLVDCWYFPQKKINYSRISSEKTDAQLSVQSRHTQYAFTRGIIVENTQEKKQNYVEAGSSRPFGRLFSWHSTHSTNTDFSIVCLLLTLSSLVDQNTVAGGSCIDLALASVLVAFTHD